MGFSAEDKYLMKCLRENKKYGAKQLLKRQHKYCCWTYWVVVDLALSAQYSTCVVNFFDQYFQSTKTPVFVRKLCK